MFPSIYVGEISEVLGLISNKEALQPE